MLLKDSWRSTSFSPLKVAFFLHPFFDHFSRILGLLFSDQCITFIICFNKACKGLHHFEQILQGIRLYLFHSLTGVYPHVHLHF